MARKPTKKTTKSKPAKEKAPASAKGAKKPAAKKAPSRPETAGMIADVRELVELMTANDITEVNMQHGDVKIVLHRGQVYQPDLPTSAAAPVVAEAKLPVSGDANAAEKDNLAEIVSPMVGTFYAAPSPDSDPYASVGSNVTEDTVVCIIEAMKVMNEIKAECSGKIAEVCVKNAQPVEFGQVLFRVRPA